MIEVKVTTVYIRSRSYKGIHCKIEVDATKTYTEIEGIHWMI